MNDLIEQVDKRKLLISIAKNYPLALSRLWVPHCHRWDGLGDKSKRAKGCGKPMQQKAPGVYHCPHCVITEKRTSQRAAIVNLGDVATAVFGGNRSGKTQSGAMLACATAAGKDQWWVRQWMELNNLPEYVVPNKKPATVISSSLSYGDSIAYIRPKLDQYLPVGTRRVRWNSQDRATAFLPNGGKIISLSASSGREAYQGLHCELAWLDEEHKKDLFQECLTRTIDSGTGRVLLTMTPLMGYTWPSEFIDNNIEGFTYSKITGLDNPFISSEKMVKTFANMSAESQASRLHGHFSNQSGLVYPEVDKAVHVVKPFELTDDYAIDLGVDFGVVNPFAGILTATNEKTGRVFIIGEYYATERTVIQNCKAMQAKFAKYWDRIRYVVADPEDKNGRLTMARYGIPNKPASKHIGVVNSIQIVKNFLALSADDKPRLQIFENCIEILKEFRRYRWATGAGKDKPVKRDDHGLDALRYLMIFLDRLYRRQ